MGGRAETALGGNRSDFSMLSAAALSVSRRQGLGSSISRCAWRGNIVPQRMSLHVVHLSFAGISFAAFLAAVALVQQCFAQGVDVEGSYPWVALILWSVAPFCLTHWLG